MPLISVGAVWLVVLVQWAHCCPFLVRAAGGPHYVTSLLLFWVSEKALEHIETCVGQRFGIEFASWLLAVSVILLGCATCETGVPHWWPPHYPGAGECQSLQEGK